jgi:DNA-binding LytR/AlgR family response regulator
MKLRCVIVDDEYLAIRILEEYSARCPSLTVLQSFKDPLAATRFLEENETDLLFLDIQMPQLSGIEMAGRLTAPVSPLVIFTTARHEFAVQAFELNALDYLVKPISFERFEKAIRKAEEYLGADSESWRSDPASLLIRSDHKTTRVPYADISLIEGLNEYVRIHTPYKRIITLAALKDLENELPGDQFIRIHKSYIVARMHIRSWNASELELSSGQRLPIGRVYKENFLRQVTRP